ncbi:hypothetical protein RQP46_004720 [Phenoliferia psychrophenolica]
MSNSSKAHIEHLDHEKVLRGNVDDSEAAYKTIASRGANRRLVWLVVFSCVAAFTYGFSAAIVASSLGQPNLYIYFNLTKNPNLNGIIGAMFVLLPSHIILYANVHPNSASLFNVGGFFGVFIGSFICKRWGRRWGFFTSALFCFLGAGLAAGSISLTMLILGRFFTGSVGVALMVGYVVAQWCGYGFFFLASPSNWRAPFALQVITPLIILGSLPFVPESPRWLEGQGRSEEALAVLKSVHKWDADPEFRIAREEHLQIKLQTELEKTLTRSWYSMFFGKYYKRTLVAILVPAANQMPGANLLPNFGPRLYASLGFSPAQSLLFQAGWYMTGMSLALFTILVVDRFGRVKLLAGATIGCSLFISVEAALSARIEMITARGEVPSSALQSAAVSIIFLWNVFAVWVTVSQPTAQANIGWKFYLVFIIPTFFLGVLQFIVLPETKNVPLEEVGGLFGDKDDVAIYSTDIHIDEAGAAALK